MISNMPATFLITIRSQPKHGILYTAAIEVGGGKALAVAIGLCECSVNQWLNLRKYPKRAFNAKLKTQRTRERERINTALAKIGTSADECWPPEVRKFIDDTRDLKSLIHEETQAVPLQQLTGSVMKSLTTEGDTEREAEQQELRDRLPDVLKTLSYREREIIKLRYGLGDVRTFTLEETAHVFRSTRERIRQIEAKALRKLQQPFRADMLSGFID